MYGFQLRRQILQEKRKTRLVFLVFLFFFSLYMITTLVFDDNGLLRYLELKNKKTQILTEIQRLQEENTRLRQQIQLLQTDPFYLEKMAREELNLSRPDEYIFYFEE